VDVEGGVKLVKCFDEVGNLLLFCFAAKTQCVSNFRIAVRGVRMRVLAECTHLNGAVAAVKANNIRQQQGVAHTMR
jgi:hypothetical protein